MYRKQIKEYLEYLIKSLDTSDFVKKNPKVNKENIKEFLEKQIKSLSLENTYKLFSDGASRGNPGLAGAGYIILDENGEEVFSGKKFLHEKTNNEAEYLALILALEKIHELGINRVDIFMDSELVVKQLKGEYKVKNRRLKPLYERVLTLLENFDYKIFHVKREKNKSADKLANRAIDEAKGIFKK